MRAHRLIVACASLLIPAAAFGQRVDDAQIAAIVVTANQVDVDAGRLAADATANAEVKKFAELMVSDHTAVNQAAAELVARLGVTPQSNATSEGLAKAGADNLDRLRQLRGAALDRAYVDHEVAYHEQVIAAIDGTLIPGASNAELKALLVKVRPAFDAHLEHARQLQKSLGSR